MQLAEYLAPEKLGTPLKVGAVAAPAFSIFETYLFDDWQFLAFLCILVLIDTITGFWKAFKYKKIQSAAFGRLFEKIAVYAISLVTIHALSEFPKTDTAQVIFGWIEHLGYAAFMVRESISIFENLGAIRPNMIPPFILRRLKNFDETGEFKASTDTFHTNNYENERTDSAGPGAGA